MILKPHELLKELRIKKGFATAADAARAYGWAPTTYQAHENGSRGIKRDAAARYAKAFGSTAAYILGLNEDSVGPEALQPVSQVINVPVVARASAGTFRFDEGLEDGEILVPAVPHKGVPAEAQYSVIVDGPSVNLRIPDGAFAICAFYDKYPGGPQHGQLVHVVRERAGLHEHTIKELRYTREGIILMPCSSDPRYQEQVVLATGEDNELVRIQGVVIGSYQPL